MPDTGAVIDAAGMDRLATAAANLSSHAGVLNITDEAQEMTPEALSELRLLASARFDPQPLL
jgi:type II secretory pathway predicted ATPase ExeA